MAHGDADWGGGSGLAHKDAGWGGGGVSFTDVFWHLGVWSFIIYNFWLPLFRGPYPCHLSHLVTTEVTTEVDPDLYALLRVLAWGHSCFL